MGWDVMDGIAWLGMANDYEGSHPRMSRKAAPTFVL